MRTLTLSTFRSQSKIFQGKQNIVEKYFHVPLNKDGFQCYFHLEFFYSFQVLGIIPVLIIPHKQCKMHIVHGILSLSVPICVFDRWM